MKISKRCEYAIRCLIEINVRQDQIPISAEFISERQEIPKKFLGAILTDLKKAGFVKSKKGPDGGYELAKSPTDIFIWDVINLLDGGESYQINFSTILRKEAAYTSQVLKDSFDEIEAVKKETMRRFTLRELTSRYYRFWEGDSDYSI